MSEQKRSKINQLLKTAASDRQILAQGWVKTRRDSKGLVFIELNDGSTILNLQIVVDLQAHSFDTELLKKITTGASIGVWGKLQDSPAKGQSIELHAEKIELYGRADSEEYPLQKKGHSLEFLREVGHLRVRTNTFSAMFRLRHHLSFLVHQFFHQKGFFYVHTPIVTASDCEGAGEMFRVTTLNLDQLPRQNGQIDFSKDFFGKAAHLTVSGQLNGELLAMGLGEIYTFGPTFRAENSNTSRHLAEFWMIEPEMAFYDIEDNQNLAEEFLKFLITEIRKNSADDLAFFEKWYDKELTAKLDMVVNHPFERIDYTQAVEILQKSGEIFEFKVSWGDDLKSEHERYLVEKYFKKPVIVTNYPKEIKAFYMKQNSDGKTVRAMDVLFPGVGEIIGGSQREENYDTLVARLQELELNLQDYSWYLDSRRFGTVAHSGFGLGFERLLLFVTGMGNIRDVIPFPRYPMHALF